MDYLKATGLSFICLAIGILTTVSVGQAKQTFYLPTVDTTITDKLHQTDSTRVLVKLKESHEVPSISRFSTAKRKDRFISRSEIRKRQRQFKNRIKTRNLIGKLQVSHSFANLPLLSMRIDAAGLAALENDPNVAMVVADKRVYASLTESGPLIQSPKVHSYGYTGEGVTVAVIDSGIDTDHPDLVDDLVWEECFLSDGGCLASEETRASGPGSAESGANNHGTHVSSIITSADATYPGIAPDAGIVAIRVLDTRGYGYYSDILAGLDWVISNKDNYDIRVVNLSLGGIEHFGADCDDNFPNFRDAADAAEASGTHVFAASGNRAIKAGLPVPACLSQVTSVGAVYDSDLDTKDWRYCTDLQPEADLVTCFSNASTELDLLAPGAAITVSSAFNNTITKSGTSQASPHAAAAAALLLEKDPDLTPNEVETILKDSGVVVRDPANGLTYPRIDLMAALKGVKFSIIIPSELSEGDGFLAGQGSISVTSSIDEDIEVTLTSDDTSEITISPGTLTLYSGETSVPFDLSVIDDSLLDGTREVQISASGSSPSWNYDTDAILQVVDNESASITIHIPPTANEGAGLLVAQGQINLDSTVDEDVTLSLTSNYPHSVEVLDSIVILSGQNSAQFDLNILDDVDIQGNIEATISSTMMGWVSGSATIEIMENDPKYFVNDISSTHDAWCTAPGNDLNTGLLPSSPKASVQAILDSYDLEPGDVVAIDTGDYILTENIVITEDDQGSFDAPVGFVASPYGVVIDRNSSGNTSYGWELSNADNIQIQTAIEDPIPETPRRWMRITGGDTGVSLVGTENISIDRVEISGNYDFGVFVSAGDNYVFRNCLVVNNGDSGLSLYGGTSTRELDILLDNLTVAGNGGSREISIGRINGVTMRNSIIWADGSSDVCVGIGDNLSVKDFDYNLLYGTNGAFVGDYNGNRASLLDWQKATGQDLSSLSSPPIFVDTGNGDYHLQSTGGSYHDDAWNADADISPGVDTGDPSLASDTEPIPNGGLRNLGAYGGTELASKSPTERTLVLQSPVGREILRGPVTITWLALGTDWEIDDTVRLDYSTDDGQIWNPIAATVPAQGGIGYTGYEWDTVGLPDSPLYRIRVQSNSDSFVEAVSDGSFTVHNNPIHYYVNDASLANDAWCTAPGVGPNDGLSPASPKASIPDVLETYDLEPGDMVYIDTGDYVLDSNIVVSTADQGSLNDPVEFAASPYGVVLDRNETALGSYGWHFQYSANVRVYTSGEDLLTGTSRFWMRVTGADEGLFFQGATHIAVERVEASGNAGYGFIAYTSGGDNLEIHNCLVVNNGDGGIYLWGGATTEEKDIQLINLTIAANGGTRELRLSDIEGIILRNSIIWADGGDDVCITAYDATTPFGESDYNLFYNTNGANMASFSGVVPTLSDWQAISGVDTHSSVGDPLFVDYISGDWHLQSTSGSYHDGNWGFDAQDSPAIDRGNPGDDFSYEPRENGDQVNLGAYGGTEQASKTSVLLGDINLDGHIDLRDVVTTLQVLSGDNPDGPYSPEADINNDGVVGIPEALNALQEEAGLRKNND